MKQFFFCHGPELLLLLSPAESVYARPMSVAGLADSPMLVGDGVKSLSRHHPLFGVSNLTNVRDSYPVEKLPVAKPRVVDVAASCRKR